MTDFDSIDFFRGKELTPDPYPYFDHLREQCPLHHETAHEPSFYVLSRFNDVVGVLKQPDQWGNRHGPGVFYHAGIALCDLGLGQRFIDSEVALDFFPDDLPRPGEVAR